MGSSTKLLACTAFREAAPTHIYSRRLATQWAIIEDVWNIHFFQACQEIYFHHDITLNVVNPHYLIVSDYISIHSCLLSSEISQ